MRRAACPGDGAAIGSREPGRWVELTRTWRDGDRVDIELPMPTETAWGNPPTNHYQTVMNAFKTAGFKTVRIPVAWNQYADADGNISPAWMARTTQVVDCARNACGNTHGQLLLALPCASKRAR